MNGGGLRIDRKGAKMAAEGQTRREESFELKKGPNDD